MNERGNEIGFDSRIPLTFPQLVDLARQYAQIQGRNPVVEVVLDWTRQLVVAHEELVPRLRALEAAAEARNLTTRCREFDDAEAAIKAVEARLDDPAAGGPNFAVLAHQLAEATKAVLEIARDGKEQWDFVAHCIGAGDPNDVSTVYARAEEIRDAQVARLEAEPGDPTTGIAAAWWLTDADGFPFLNLTDEDQRRDVLLVPARPR